LFFLCETNRSTKTRQSNGPLRYVGSIYGTGSGIFFFMHTAALGARPTFCGMTIGVSYSGGKGNRSVKLTTLFHQDTNYGIKEFDFKPYKCKYDAS
jgi:hypothetical protein